MSDDTTVIRAQLMGSNRCTALGVEANGSAPVLDRTAGPPARQNAIEVRRSLTRNAERRCHGGAVGWNYEGSWVTYRRSSCLSQA